MTDITKYNALDPQLENVDDELEYMTEEEMEEEDWKDASASMNIDVLLQFKEMYPASKHCFEANRLITQIENDESTKMNGTEILEARINFANSADDVCDAILELQECGIITLKNLTDCITKDHNLLSSAACSKIIERGILNRRDLNACGISNEYIEKMLEHEMTQNFDAPPPLSSIDTPCTEVYFWGIPSSGKTCALGGILSVAKSGAVARSMIPDNTCQGFGYMNRLSNVFEEGKVSRLPGGTPVTSTYEMRFELQDQEMNIHPIACMDMAGELFTCMFMKDAGEQLRDDQLTAMNTLDSILLDNRSTNRKIHFFVIEYGAEDRNYNDLPQREYLNAAAVHLGSQGVFKDQTDAIFIIITKVDKARYSGSLDEHLKQYLKKNYLGFYNNLRRICEDNEINGGKVVIMPFTIGDVCFKDYCMFDSSSSKKVVELFLRRCYGEKRDKFTSFMNRFKN